MLKGAADPENLISHFRNSILISKAMGRLLTDFKESFQFKSSVCFAIKFPLSNPRKEQPEYANGDNVAPPLLTKCPDAWFLRVWSLKNSVCNSHMENVQRSPEEIKLGHMSFGELSNTRNIMIHKDTLAFFELWMYVGE